MKTYSLRWGVRYGLLVLLLSGASTGIAAAQDAGDDEAEELVDGWNTDLTGKLAASQAAYNNWQEGGLNTLAFTTGVDGKAVNRAARWTQTYELRLSFGLIKQDTLDVRKADDLIRLNAALQYAGDDFFQLFQPTLSVSARTQFAAGFNYQDNPFAEPPLSDEAPPVKVSDFFSPASFTQAVGLTYDPEPWFTTRLGFGAKETVVLIDRLRPLYGLDPDETVMVEAGLESRTQFDREVFENIRLQSTLSLFMAFNKPEQPDMIWENVVTMQVNSWMNVNLEFVSVYDKDVSSKVQLKEVLSLGVAFVLI